MTFKPTVIILESKNEFSWLDSLVIPGIFDGEHIFQLEQINNTKMKFIHRENFSGYLVPLLWKSLNSDTRRGFEEMNKVLKEKVESGKKL